MKAHIVGGGFGGLAAAAYLIRNAGMSGKDIMIYEAERQMGGGFFLGGTAQTGYNLPGSVFDNEFRCTFDLLQGIPSTGNPGISVKDEFFTFNNREMFQDRVHIIDRNGLVLHRPHFGLNLRDAIDLAKLALTPESHLDGRLIKEFFREQFFDTEFWWLWSTIMGSLPEHSAAEFRRYMNRALALFPDLSDMKHILRTPVCQYQTFIEPLVAWLRPRGVNFLAGAFVRDIGFDPAPDRITVNRIDFEQDGATQSAVIGSEDIVLATLGSQVENMSVGSMKEPPIPQSAGRSSALWRRLAEKRPGFGNPELYFGPQKPSSRWVSFTVTTTETSFIDQLSKMTLSKPGLGGLLTLKDSGWVLSVTVFHQPEVIGQPPGTHIWWGYGLYPERNGDFVKKRMDACTGEEILSEVLQQLRFDQMDEIMASSICIPCDMPFVNNIWLARGRTDRPAVVPEGATNLGLIGQYVEVPKDIAFTIEYSARTAWEAVHQLLRRGPPPPKIFQGQFDPKALWGALRVFLSK